MNLHCTYHDYLLSLGYNWWESKWWDPKDILGGYRYDKTGGRLNIEWLAALGIALRSISIDLQPGSNWLELIWGFYWFPPQGELLYSNLD